ncbi:TPA: hypothetical protein DCW54_03290 [Candidatus Dependentiae bacterium]|nr:hypothetical protein [Candidatus Dependentiae bacterium]
MASAMTALRVKELLREKGWTTKVLAEKTGMSESYLTHIKNSTRRWNQDSLERLALAFNIDPLELFAQRRAGGIEVETVSVRAADIDFVVQMVPVLGEIPAQPSAKNNQVMQVATGCKGQFIPVQGVSDDAMFALRVSSNSLTPAFEKNDLLVVAPSMAARSGDIAVVEYGDGNVSRGVFKINQTSELILLESVNGKQSSIALTRGKDQFRFIGRVVARYQNLA